MTPVKQVRKTPAQKKAFGSVFVNSIGQRAHEAKTEEAYQACKRLGMSMEHGL